MIWGPQYFFKAGYIVVILYYAIYFISGTSSHSNPIDWVKSKVQIGILTHIQLINKSAFPYNRLGASIPINVKRSNTAFSECNLG